jgi:secreted PhoX family phosphatase
MSRLILPSRRDLSRRQFLRRVFLSAGAVATAGYGLLAPRRGIADDAPASSLFADLGPLGDPDANGIRLPAGYSSRVLAVSGRMPARRSDYRWHTFPDGGAVFPASDGGWAYANNSEFPERGGAGVLRFDANGEVVDAYPILTGTSLNCAGGPTPWGTWMSCEERGAGQVWECEPFGTPEQAVVHPALGRFHHEAVAVDPFNRVLYLTEDHPTGRFYRFVPSARDWPEAAPRPRLQQGRLQVLRIEALTDNQYPPTELDLASPQAVVWADVVQPLTPQLAVRESLGEQAPGTVFKGGEGLWYFEGLVYFSTKGDNRIWALDPSTQTLQTIYDFATAEPPDNILSGVDNLTVSRYGDVLVCEDGGDMQLCAILPDGSVKAILQVTGQDESEITGPAFSPDGRRIYFNSQRGSLDGRGTGITYEVRLPG